MLAETIASVLVRLWLEGESPGFQPQVGIEGCHKALFGPWSSLLNLKSPGSGHVQGSGHIKAQWCLNHQSPCFSRYIKRKYSEKKRRISPGWDIAWQ